MNITEKLGITPETHGKVFCEMLEAIIKWKASGDGVREFKDVIYADISFTDIIEKATGKTWEEIRGMRWTSIF